MQRRRGGTKCQRKCAAKQRSPQNVSNSQRCRSIETSKRDAESVSHFRLRIIRALPSAATLLGAMLLEENLAGDLNDSILPAQRVDRPKLTIRDVSNWVSKVRRISGVE